MAELSTLTLSKSSSFRFELVSFNGSPRATGSPVSGILGNHLNPVAGVGIDHVEADCSPIVPL
jgi:hypothetical protein